jgi:hypothetical protein
MAKVTFDQESDKNGPLRVCVDAATGAALKGSEEERSAGRGLKDLHHVSTVTGRVVSRSAWMAYLRFSKIVFAIKVHYEHVGWLHELLLHAARCNVDLVFMANTGTSAGTCYLASFACQSRLLHLYLSHDMLHEG